jgi:hypothetical protein
MSNHLLDMEPKPLLADLAKRQPEHQEDGYVACPAIKAKHKNTFFTAIPYDFTVQFVEGQMYSTHPESVVQRPGLYENSFSFNWHMNRTFFSETPQIMEVTPAYLHPTVHSRFGHAPSGAFDIGKWFRPSSPNFQLWSNLSEFHAKKDDAHLYFNFPSEERIVLKQFVMTEKLFEIQDATLNHKEYFPKQNLNSIYSRFTQNGISKILLKEIKENLL